MQILQTRGARGARSILLVLRVSLSQFLPNLEAYLVCMLQSAYTILDRHTSRRATVNVFAGKSKQAGMDLLPRSLSGCVLVELPSLPVAGREGGCQQ